MAKGVLLKTGAGLIRVLEFLCAALILGIFSYFLAYLTRHHHNIPRWMKAVEGISGGAVLYTAFAVILVCFLGGLTVFAFLGLLLDVLFIGAFIAIAVLARAGSKKCSGARSPLFNNRIRDCRFQRAVFAIAILGALLFFLSAILNILLNRHHKKEKKFGPGPSNNYTSGTAKKQPFWKRSRKPKTHDAELGAVGAGVVGGAAEKHHHNKPIRPSHDTGVTDSTAVAPDGTYGGLNNKYQEPTYPQTTGPVLYDREPYAEVHHGGVPHAAHAADVPTATRY